MALEANALVLTGISGPKVEVVLGDATEAPANRQRMPSRMYRGSPVWPARQDAEDAVSTTAVAMERIFMRGVSIESRGELEIHAQFSSVAV
jgi:hypothetical protein